MPLQLAEASLIQRVVALWSLGKVLANMSLSEALRKHFLDPQNVGELANATSTGTADNAACGDRVVLSICIANERVEDVSFRAKACSAVIATASLATTAARGLSVTEARALDVAALVSGAGGLPRHKGHAIAVVARALDLALQGA